MGDERVGEERRLRHAGQVLEHVVSTFCRCGSVTSGVELMIISV